MAKKAKARASKRAAPKRTEEAAKPSDTMKVPSEPKLRSLLRAVKNVDADRNEANGRKGSMIAAAVERDHLDKKAWSIACGLERMSQQKGSITWAHLQHYVEALGLEARFSQQAEMFEKESDEQEPEQEQPEPAATNGSFAAKVKAQQERTTSLANPKHQPTPEQVKDIADRAGAGTTH